MMNGQHTVGCLPLNGFDLNQDACVCMYRWGSAYGKI